MLLIRPLPPGPDFSVSELNITILIVMFFVQELPAARTESWHEVQILKRELLMLGGFSVQSLRFAV